MFPKVLYWGSFVFRHFFNKLTYTFLGNCKLHPYADDNLIMYQSQELICMFAHFQTDFNSAYFQKFSINCIYYFTKECNIYYCADDNYIPLNHNKLTLVHDALEEGSTVMLEWFNSNPLHANPCKFQDIKFKSAKKANAWVSSLYWGHMNWISTWNQYTRCLYWWWYEFQQSCKGWQTSLRFTTPYCRTRSEK